MVGPLHPTEVWAMHHDTPRTLRSADPELHRAAGCAKAAMTSEPPSPCLLSPLRRLRVYHPSRSQCLAHRGTASKRHHVACTSSPEDLFLLARPGPPAVTRGRHLKTSSLARRRCARRCPATSPSRSVVLAMRYSIRVNSYAAITMFVAAMAKTCSLWSTQRQSLRQRAQDQERTMPATGS